MTSSENQLQESQGTLAVQKPFCRKWHLRVTENMTSLALQPEREMLRRMSFQLWWLWKNFWNTANFSVKSMMDSNHRCDSGWWSTSLQKLQEAEMGLHRRRYCLSLGHMVLSISGGSWLWFVRVLLLQLLKQHHVFHNDMNCYDVWHLSFSEPVVTLTDLCILLCCSDTL